MSEVSSVIRLARMDASNWVFSSNESEKTIARLKPVENTTMLKNRRTVTAHSDTNAVFTFAEIWRMVNMANPLKYTPRRRWTNRMKNPDADQNRLSVPMSINAVAVRKCSPK